MKIEIIKNTVCDGKPVAIGDVVMATAEAATTLINLGKAKIYQVMDHIEKKAKKKPSTRKKVAK